MPSFFLFMAILIAMTDRWIDRFATYLRAERHYSEQTLEAYLPALEGCVSFFTPEGGTLDWGTLTPDDVRLWIAAQMEQRLSPLTINKRLSALRSFYKFMLMHGAVQADPTRLVSGPKKSKKLPSFVREREMDRLFDHFTFPDDYFGRRDRLILLIFYSTGIRLSELVGLDINSINLHSSTLKVLGKRNKERIIPFGAELREAISDYLPLRAEQPMAAHSTALFLGQRVPRITKVAVGNIVRHTLGQITTLQRRSPHVLRHSFATAMLNNGAEIEVVRQLMQEWEATLGRKLWMVLELVPRAKAFHQEPRL